MEVIAFKVIGRVQGVGFRFFTCNLANALGVRGTVRNLPEGSVLVHAAAEPDQMALFRERLRKGPAFGRVDQLQEECLSPESAASWNGFQVRY